MPDPNDHEAFVDFIRTRLMELGAGWMAAFIMDSAWEQVSEEFNNEWIDHCNEEDDDE
jgi:hypothetical protein